ncbi:hypothetical protein [Ekhidna sp.]|jgi:hypothetical protein|uniref:hypothetical protein n=1 Tax=Ekhidna sp. TaxID=2608089 RepID=UPI0032EED94D
MEKENKRIIELLIDFIPTVESVIPLIKERDQNFKDGQKQVENLKSAKIPEPHYKIQGGAYKNPNYKKHKDAVIINLRDKHQKLNQEIYKNVINELKKDSQKEILETAKKEGVHKLLDKGLEKLNSEGKTDLATNKDVRRFIREQGFNPDKTKDQDKPMDREPTEKIPEPEKLLSSKEQKGMDISKNKKDMGMDRDR